MAQQEKMEPLDKRQREELNELSVKRDGSQKLTDEEVSKAIGGMDTLKWRCDKGISGREFKAWSSASYIKCKDCSLYFETTRRNFSGSDIITFYCDFLGWTREFYGNY